MIRKFKTEIRGGHVVIVYYRDDDAIPTAIYPVGPGGPIDTLVMMLQRINSDPNCIHDIDLTITSSTVGRSDEPPQEPSEN